MPQLMDTTLSLIYTSILMTLYLINKLSDILNRNQSQSFFALHEFLLCQALEVSHSAHATHHLLHFRIRAHFLHHVHEVSCAAELSHHLGVDHGLQFSQELIGVSHHVDLIVTLAEIGLTHFADQAL